MIEITINGEKKNTGEGLSVRQFLASLGLDDKKVALERNREIVPKSAFDKVVIKPGDELEIVHFIGGGDHGNDPFIVADKEYSSRLIVGTGKYKDFEQNKAAVEASGAEIITVAVRRVNISDPGQPMLTDYLDPKKYTYLPNTAGCFSAEEALRTLRLAREAGGWDLVKLEVLGDEKTLYPNMLATFEATKVLVKERCTVMVYCNDDPIAARTMGGRGCVAVVPAGAPIGRDIMRKAMEEDPMAKPVKADLPEPGMKEAENG